MEAGLQTSHFHRWLLTPAGWRQGGSNAALLPKSTSRARPLEKSKILWLRGKVQRAGTASAKSRSLPTLGFLSGLCRRGQRGETCFKPPKHQRGGVIIFLRLRRLFFWVNWKPPPSSNLLSFTFYILLGLSRSVPPPVTVALHTHVWASHAAPPFTC